MELCDCISFINVCAVVMCHDFSNGICSSGLKILVLQYYLEIKVPKMVRKNIYLLNNHQTGVKITIL